MLATASFQSGPNVPRADTALLPGLIDGLEVFVPKLTLVRVPNATHWIIHEQPALVARLIDEFLAAGKSANQMTT